MKKIHISIVNSVLIITTLAGCSLTGNPSSSDELSSNTENYQVEVINLTEPVYETIRTENIEQPNCNGTSDVDNVVERTMGINHAIEIGLGLTVDVDGKLELFGTGVNLGAAISNELGYQYGVTESISRSIIVRAAPKTHVIHTIKLSEIWETGTARVIVNGQSADIPFRFRADFSIDLLDSIPVECPTGQAITSQPTVIVTSVSIATNTSSIENTSETWSRGELLYEENFEDGAVSELETKFGRFDIVETNDGNHVWRATSSSLSQMSLPTTSNDYVVEAKIMQVSDGSGFGFVEIRKELGNPCDSGYAVYLDLYGDWLNLIERDQTCEELRSTGLFANYKISLLSGVWYIVRIEANGGEVRVYLNEKLVAQDIDTDNTIRKSNTIDVATCCGDLEPFIFDFDDIKAWLINQ